MDYFSFREEQGSDPSLALPKSQQDLGRVSRSDGWGIGWNHHMPAKRATPKGYEHARQLRKNLTPAEAKLWAYLRGKRLGVSFRRQHAVGPYIADFCCIKKKLIIEVDGSQHLAQSEYDAARTKYLESQRYKVIRFWNNQVMNDIEGVIRVISFALDEQ